MGQAARRRVLVKNADAIERLAAAKTVIFDKTGTLTSPDMCVAAWLGEDDFQSLVGALEAHSKHPVARALAGYASNARVTSVIEDPGCGLRGVVEGRALVVGAPGYVSAWAKGSEYWDAAADDLALRGMTPVAIAVDGVVVAVAGVTARIHDDARITVGRLTQAGVVVQLLSGDNPQVVERVAREVGIAVFEGGASPERKLELVRNVASRGVVAMVGDGVNDAAALAAADVGVAVRGGAEASLAVADVYVDRLGVAAIADMIEGSRRALGTVRVAFACGLVYNIIGVSLAIAGIVTPLMAAIIMPASSLTVVTLAYRRRAFRSEP
jgi:Cu2+-exporting ATPase